MVLVKCKTIIKHTKHSVRIIQVLTVVNIVCTDYVLNVHGLHVTAVKIIIKPCLFKSFHYKTILSNIWLKIKK